MRKAIVAATLTLTALAGLGITAGTASAAALPDLVIGVSANGGTAIEVKNIGIGATTRAFVVEVTNPDGTLFTNLSVNQGIAAGQTLKVPFVFGCPTPNFGNITYSFRADSTRQQPESNERNNLKTVAGNNC